MLKKNLYIIFAFVVFVVLQLCLLFNQQLFGDEAFYWLEGQYLGLSYSELPGWTAWMTRLGSQIFGNNYFAVRIVSYLAFLSIFRAVFLINNSIKTPVSSNYLLLLAIPIFSLIGVMALPDVWLVVFVMWITVYFIKAIEYKKISNWVVLGIIIACSINVHVRMWIWLFIAGLTFLLVYGKQFVILKPLIFITLPIALIGFLPIIWFNLHNDYVLLAFQFSQRHPWQFQIENIGFLLSQLIVITPLVLLLWFKNIFNFRNQQPLVKWIILTAGLHWLLYVVLSLFADGYRTTVHWVLISYVPVLSIAGLWFMQNTMLTKWAVSTGLLVSLWLLLVLNFNILGVNSTIGSKILDNSTGWKEISTAVKRISKEQNTENIIADYFMTGAELAFELEAPKSIKVLSHKKNIKHGRQKQLQIWGMLLEDPKSFKEKALLIVEDTTLKLQNKGKYYTQLCKDFNSIELLENLSVEDTGKLFHIFIVNDGDQCEIPPLFYTQVENEGNQLNITGWAVLHNSGIKKLYFKSGDRNIVISNNRLKNTGVEQIFPETLDVNRPNIGFEVDIPLNLIKNNKFQIMAISNDNKSYLSQNYYLD